MTDTDMQAFVDEVTNTLERFEQDSAKWEHLEILARGVHNIHRYLQEVPTPDGRVVALYAALQYSWHENSDLRKKLQQADKNISTLIESNAKLTDLVFKMDERLQRVESRVVEGSTHDALTDGSTMWSDGQNQSVSQGYIQQKSSGSTLENRHLSQSVSQSFQSVNQLKPSGKPSDGRLQSGEYDEYIRVCRRAKIAVEDIAAEIGISKSGVERRITILRKGGRL
jgi:hypothetical protein